MLKFSAKSIFKTKTFDSPSSDSFLCSRYAVDCLCLMYWCKMKDHICFLSFSKSSLKLPVCSTFWRCSLFVLIFVLFSHWNQFSKEAVSKSKLQNFPSLQLLHLLFQQSSVGRVQTRLLGNSWEIRISGCTFDKQHNKIVFQVT